MLDFARRLMRGTLSVQRTFFGGKLSGLQRRFPPDLYKSTSSQIHTFTNPKVRLSN
jgi:hypothetical protein